MQILGQGEIAALREVIEIQRNEIAYLRAKRDEQDKTILALMNAHAYRQRYPEQVSAVQPVTPEALASAVEKRGMPVKPEFSLAALQERVKPFKED